MHWTTETDVLVLGAGGCGLVASLAAHEEGVRVGIYEKAEREGGTTSLSAGSIPGAGTLFQKEAGISDSPGNMFSDLMTQSGPHEMGSLLTLLVHESAPLVEWLVDTVGVDLRLNTDFRHVGHSVPRLHAQGLRWERGLLLV